jgi:hypothetical protein
VIDMSSAYAGQVDSARRGVALLPSGCVVIQDELGGLKPGAQVRWGMVTRARPGETGSDRLQLTERGKSLELRILKPAGAAWNGDSSEFLALNLHWASIWRGFHAPSTLSQM